MSGRSLDNSLRQIERSIQELKELEWRLQEFRDPRVAYLVRDMIEQLNVFAYQLKRGDTNLKLLTELRKRIQEALAQFGKEVQDKSLRKESHDVTLYLREAVYELEINLNRLNERKADFNFTYQLRKKLQEIIEHLKETLLYARWRFPPRSIDFLQEAIDLLGSTVRQLGDKPSSDTLLLVLEKSATELRKLINNLPKESSLMEEPDLSGYSIRRSVFIIFTLLEEILNKLEDDLGSSVSCDALESSNVDVYLTHEFHCLEQEREIEERVGNRGKTTLLPMLIRVSDSNWNSKNIPDCQVIYRLGDIIGCLGSRATLEALRNDSKVISVEASRSTDGWDSKFDKNYQSNGRKVNLFERTSKWLTRLLELLKTKLASFLGLLKKNSQNRRGLSEPLISTELLPNSQISSSVSLVQADFIHQLHHEEGDAALVAIIDTGVDILHEAFLDSTGTRSRILAVWDQTDDTGDSPSIPGIEMAFGTEYTQAQIEQYIRERRVPTSLGRDSQGHGTHVASIAAGRAGIFSGGIAPNAKIVVVIPKIQTNPRDSYSLGYSISHGAALAYIKHVANQHRLPVVVNISQGMNAGAHDGTSPLELSFDNFSGGGRSAGYVIVKSAGNERNQKNHAKLCMARNSYDCLSWYSSHRRRKNVIELWFKSCNTFKFRLRNPNGEQSQWVFSDTELRGVFTNNNSYQISYEKYHRDNGDSRLLITVSANFSNSIVKGDWRLDIESLEIKSGREPIHAWIERDMERAIYFTTHVSEETTLSVPGTAKTVISVGSVNNSIPFRVSEYSSYGPTRDGRNQPELAAPGESIRGAKAGSDDGVDVDSGTSFAAPHVTGAIALLLSLRAKQCLTNTDLEQFNAAQIRAAICQATHNYTGDWHQGMGFGVLDVKELFTKLQCFCS